MKGDLPRIGGGLILETGRGQHAGNPITSHVELARKLQELCGAEGFRVDERTGLILALRWDKDGNEVVIERFQPCAVNG